LSTETGDKTYASRVARYNEMKALRDRGLTYDEIGSYFINPRTNKPISRQVVQKQLARGVVRPAGRPRGYSPNRTLHAVIRTPRPVPLQVVATPPNDRLERRRAAIIARMEAAHASQIEALRAGKVRQAQRITERLEALYTKLQALR
jgi:hypothetical protein